MTFDNEFILTCRGSGSIYAEVAIDLSSRIATPSEFASHLFGARDLLGCPAHGSSRSFVARTPRWTWVRDRERMCARAKSTH